MNDQDLAQAKTVVVDILDALNVGRVVNVDDWNNNTPTVEDTIAAALTIEAKNLLPLFPELGEYLPDDPDILRQRIRDLWPTLGGDLRAERSKDILGAAWQNDGEEHGDNSNIVLLENIIPKERLISLSPSEWDEQKEDLLQESQDNPMLFIFDNDLSRSGGDPEGGIKIITSLLARNDAGSLMCGLLTNKVTPETQPEQWETLSKTHGIPRDRFVVIPKQYLGQSPMVFVQTLKFAALSADFTELKVKTKEIIESAAMAAADRVDAVSIYDLDHIVFQVSADEGLWEPDMLFRLHAMFHRLEARRRAHDGGELEKLAEKLRTLSGIPTKCDLLPTPGSAWALQREELYELEDHINKNHLPLELGDIFERCDVDSVKKFILLAQPCDLMVRGNGQRQPELKRIPLAEISPADEEPYYSEEMPFFDKSPTKKWYVKFKIVHFILGFLLDLCVFNQDGQARLTIDGYAPQGVRPAWKERHKVVSKYWNREIKKAGFMAPADNDGKVLRQFKQDNYNKLGDLLFDDGLFKGSLADADGFRTVTFNCKRVGRLSRARAIGLLMSYTATLGRPAYDRDFGTA